MQPAFRPAPDESDAHRRRLMREADALLDRVEDLRLGRRRSVPERLQVALRQLQAGVGQRPPDRLTVRAAHEAIFAVQQRLMAANPRRPVVRSHPGRAVGSPRVEAIRPGIAWKLLVLPPQPTAPAHESQWRALVVATVDRAFERWCFAQHHAMRAAREGERAAAALVVARVAWNNYWELLEEAERLLPDGP